MLQEIIDRFTSLPRPHAQKKQPEWLSSNSPLPRPLDNELVGPLRDARRRVVELERRAAEIRQRISRTDADIALFSDTRADEDDSLLGRVRRLLNMPEASEQVRLLRDARAEYVSELSGVMTQLGTEKQWAESARTALADEISMRLKQDYARLRELMLGVVELGEACHALVLQAQEEGLPIDRSIKLPSWLQRNVAIAPVMRNSAPYAFPKVRIALNGSGKSEARQWLEGAAV